VNITLPDLPSQQKIASILSTLDAKIELNNKINTELEAMAKTLYDYWFVQFDFPDENGKPYKSSGGEMVWSEELKREIPKGWEVKKVSDLIAEDKSGDWGKDEKIGNYIQEVFCIRGADINGLNGKEQCEPPKRFILGKNDHKLLKPYDLIVEISGGSPTQSTGRIAHISTTTAKRFSCPLICSNFCKALSLKDYKLTYNFHFFWNRLYDNKVFFGYEGKTSGIKNFLFDSFVNTNFMIVPSDEMRDEFFDFMENVEEKRQKILEENQTLAKIRDFLLPMLMNGQVVIR
jgi:type I restriction enzyme S subunit